jgi:hypothetical protein
VDPFKHVDEESGQRACQNSNNPANKFLGAETNIQICSIRDWTLSRIPKPQKSHQENRSQEMLIDRDVDVFPAIFFTH